MMAITYGEAIQQTGAQAGPGTDLVLAALPNGGTIVHAVASAAWDAVIDETTNVYLASGTFATGTVNHDGGRREENLRQVMWLTFDADLIDYLPLDREYLHNLPQDELDRLVAAQRDDLMAACAALGVPVHRLDYTGYGLCAYTYLEPAGQTEIPAIRDAHKAIIKTINERAGYKLVDAAASDSGTRITRLPGSMNVKNPAMPRRVTTLDHTPGALPIDELRFLARRTDISQQAKAAPAKAILPATVADEIIAAVAPHWTLGHKHTLALALTGMLAKAGVPHDQALAIIERLSADDEKPWDRQRCVHDTYARVHSGADVRGFFGLRDLLPESVLAYVTERLDRVKGATAPAFGRQVVGGPRGRKEYENGTEEAQSRIDRAIAAEFPPAPESAYYGWFGEYRDIMANTTEAPDVFHLGSSLALAGSMIGRRVSSEYASDPLYANLYVVLVGASGSSRKDTAMKRATRLSSLDATHRYVNPVFRIHRDVTSSEGLVKQLKENPNLLLYITEMTGMLKNTKRQATASLLDRLIEAWDTPPTMQNLAKNSGIQAIDPYLSILAATQPGRLAIEMTEEEITSGFANRWMYFAGAGKPAMARPAKLDKVRAWEHYLHLNDQIMSYNEGTSLELGADAEPRWDAWYERTTNEARNNERHEVLITRHATIIQKIALIFAVSDRARVITDAHLAAAIDLTDWMWVVVKQLSATWGVSIQSRIEERILSALRRRGPQKRWRLQQLTANSQWSQRDFAASLESMVKNETLVRDPEGYIGLNPEMGDQS